MTIVSEAQCEEVATLSFPSLDNSTMNEDDFHQDELCVQPNDPDNDEICWKLYDVAEFYEHGGYDGDFAKNDDHYDESDFASILDAAGNSLLCISSIHTKWIQISQQRYRSHNGGILTVAVNGEDVGEEWSHDYSQNVGIT